MSYLKNNLEKTKRLTRSATGKTWDVLNLLTHRNHSHHLGRSPFDKLKYAIQQHQLSSDTHSNSKETLDHLIEEVSTLGRNYFTECLKLDFEEYLFLKESLGGSGVYQIQTLDNFPSGTYDARTLINVLIDAVSSQHTILFNQPTVFKILNLIFKNDKVAKKWISSETMKYFFMSYIQYSSDVDEYINFISELHRKYGYIELLKIYHSVSEALAAYDSERS